MSLNFDKETNIAVKSDFCQKQKKATKLDQKKIEPSSLLQFSTSRGNIHEEQSFNLIPRSKEFRILSFVLVENILKQKQHSDAEKTPIVKELCSRSHNFVIKTQKFFWC